MGFKETVLGEMEKESIIPSAQTISAACALSRTVGSGRDPFVSVAVMNRSGTDEILFAEMEIGDRRFRRRIFVPSGESDTEIRMDEIYEEFDGCETECKVSVNDEYARCLCTAIGPVLFGSAELRITSSVEFADTADVSDDRAKVASLKISTSGVTDVQCCIEVSVNGKQVSQNIMSAAFSERTADLTVPKDVLTDSNLIAVKVLHSGRTAGEYSGTVRMARAAECPVPAVRESGMMVFGDVSFIDTVDTHNLNSEKTIDIGMIKLENREQREVVVTVETVFECESISFERFPIGRRSMKDIPIAVAPSVLYEDETYSANMAVVVRDDRGGTVMDRHFSVNVQSKYDMDLRKLSVRVAEFINPMSKSVVELVDDSGSPLSKILGSCHVCGYQLPDKIVTQVSAVYEALRDIGIRYVSDTCTVGGPYQKVRTPDKVLSNRSGNCLECSILFASVFEAMGFEPVIIFPKGHAIVGVVVSTEEYDSGSKLPTDTSAVYEYRMDGKVTKAIFVESTLISNERCGFMDSVNYAKQELDSGFKNGTVAAHCLIRSQRKKGISPKMM